MINGIKQRGVVGKNGKVEIQTSELPEGTVVEIIVLVDSAPQDETEYLMSIEANRIKLLDAMKRAENPGNVVAITPEEWNEKYSSAN